MPKFTEEVGASLVGLYNISDLSQIWDLVVKRGALPDKPHNYCIEADQLNLNNAENIYVFNYAKDKVLIKFRRIWLD